MLNPPRRLCVLGARVRLCVILEIQFQFFYWQETCNDICLKLTITNTNVYDMTRAWSYTVTWTKHIYVQHTDCVYVKRFCVSCIRRLIHRDRFSTICFVCMSVWLCRPTSAGDLCSQYIEWTSNHDAQNSVFPEYA